MKAPQIEFIPLRNAVSSSSTTTLDILVKITPFQPEVERKRLALNIGLVIDRSGSMRGPKIEYARLAACYAIEQLLPSDRVSVTIYDDHVETLVASTLVTDKAYITRQIEGIEPRLATALHAAWVEGGVQVSQYLNSEQLNRVILLSDGIANRGETNPDVIASDVHGLAQRGVSTTTVGVGNDYNEDLLEAMADSGDGNYYYIESVEQLPDIFQTELQGIMATIGREVRLGIEPQGDVEVVDVINDFDLSRQGEFRLPNLLVGNPFVVVVRLKVPPMNQTTDICHFRLTWDEPKQQERQRVRAKLQLPVVSAAELEEFPFNPEVQQQVALMMSARAKKEAVQKVDKGEYDAASQMLQATRSEVLNAPESPLTEQEAQSLLDLDNDLKKRRMSQYRRRSRYESRSYLRSMSQSSHGDYYVQRQERKKDAVIHQIKVIQGDITQQKVDAIVNATDNYLSGSGGVDAAIHRAAGPRLQAECSQLNGCEMGEAKITKGYNLSASWVIHTAGPVWQGGHQGEKQILAKCHQQCLTLAEQHSLRTIAFPAISTGLRGFPIEWASKIATVQAINFLYNSQFLEKVVFVCYEKKSYDYYLAALY